MVKYSFIVPVYNTEKYVDKCLKSLLKQTYKDFEIIVINDGSTDNSEAIISKYEKKYNNVKVITQKNSGLSVARNNGVKKASGQYLIFIDSDDYVEKDLLKKVDENILDVDILRYQIITEDEDGNNKIYYKENGFETTDGVKAFEIISKYHFVEPAWCYVYKRTFWNKNKFLFNKGKYHEDFGLIPYVIFSATKVNSVDYQGYHYVQRQGSIMNEENYDKTVKKAFDFLEQYLILRDKVKDKKFDKIDKSVYLSFLANSAVLKLRGLKNKEFKKYLKVLKEEKVFDDVKIDGIIRKIKKILMNLNIRLYLKVIK